MKTEAEIDRIVKAKMEAHAARYAPLNALGRPPTSACDCKAWPCSCPCHAPPKGLMQGRA